MHPYNLNTSKKSEIRAMFNNIALRYDFLNHFLSFGIDVLWRKRLIRMLIKTHPKRVLDLATGTGDLAIMAADKKIPQIDAVDLSKNMIEVGKIKVQKKNLSKHISFSCGDAEKIDASANTYDAVTVAFGVRNFENLEQGLTEIYRVLKPQRPVFILEFSQPQGFPIKQLYAFYSFTVLPLIGKIISKDRQAYTYLPESIQEFPSGNDFLKIMQHAGYKKCMAKSLSFGIATIYSGFKV